MLLGVDALTGFSRHGASTRYRGCARLERLEADAGIWTGLALCTGPVVRQRRLFPPPGARADHHRNRIGGAVALSQEQHPARLTGILALALLFVRTRKAGHR